MSQPRVCVIGAGPSGLVATKTLRERKIPCRCFERGSDVGGLWRINNDSGMSAAYDSLHINSSRQLMAFSDFPMDPRLPDFPHHSDLLKYFESYASQFGIRQSIEFQTTVEQVEPMPGQGFRVRTRHRNGTEAESFFDSVIVANGHHWKPKLPKLGGSFQGEVLHSHDYKSPRRFEGQRVLVVGIGNSGVDIACELSRFAHQTVLSTRRGAHVIPKYLLGKPLDRVASRHFWTWCPTWLRQKLFAVLLKLTRGRQSRYGLPEPDYGVLQEHPTVSSELLNLLGHGKLQVKPDIECLDKNSVHFCDESIAEFDAIIFATGYHICFPFLDAAILNTDENQVELYKNVVHPSRPGLFFAGLVQPWGPLMPLAEVQAQWIADLLENRAKLPTELQMLKAIRQQSLAMGKRYVKSSRHTIQVDFYPYLFDIRRQRKRKKGKNALPTLSANETGSQPAQARRVA